MAFLIVDDQFAPLADKIKAALKTIGTGKLRFILNTHWHGDHTGGNAAFGPEAPIIAQTNVRKRLAEGSTARKVDPAPRSAAGNHIRPIALGPFQRRRNSCDSFSSRAH